MTTRKQKEPRLLVKSICEKIDNAVSGGSKTFEWDLEVPGFGAYRTSRGRVTFVFQYRMRGGGRPQRCTIGTLGAFTVQTARDRARQLAVNVATGVDPIAAERERIEKAAREQAMILDRYFPIFLSTRDATKKPLAPHLKAAMINYVLPRIGGKHMEKITVDDLRQMENVLVQRSKTAWRNAIEVTKLVMNHAVRAGLIDKSVGGKVSTPKSDKRKRAFSPFELTRYLEAASDIGGGRGDALRMLILLCRRLREVTEMVWSEINQQDWTWLLPGNRSKNGEPLLMALPRQAIEILIRQQPDPLKRSGFVFRHTDGDRIHGVGLSNAVVIDMIDAFLDRRLDLWAGQAQAVRPAFAHFNIHDQRKTVVTIMQQKPLSIPKSLNEVILHHVTNKNGLEGVYQLYEYFDEVGEALQKWADYVDTLMSAPDAWPGGMTLPPMDLAERERRALHIREDWTERKKLYKAAKKTGARGKPPRKTSVEPHPQDMDGQSDVASSPLAEAASGKLPGCKRKMPDNRGRKLNRRGIVKTVAAEASTGIRLHPRSALAGHEDLLREMVAADPEATLEDIKAKLAGEGIAVSAVSTVWRCLAQLGIAAAPAKQQKKPIAERRRLSVAMKVPP